jgi:hypothetical protein
MISIYLINIIEADVQPKLSDVDGEDVHIMNGTGTAKKTPPHHEMVVLLLKS